MPPSPIPLSEIPTLSLLYKLNRLQPTATNTPANQTLNNKISLIRTDITTLLVDAIVNAANHSLLGGGGVDGAIHRAAGLSLLSECRALNGCATGNAKITNAYDLPCKKVIHAVGPVYWKEKKEGRHTMLLQGCYRRSLELAVENGVRSIAFSALSTGVYGYPSGEAAETAIAEVKRFLESAEGEGLERVVFCSFEAKDERAYERLIPKFFPPTEKDLSAKDQQQQAHEGALLADMPDAPSKEPLQEGQPEAKKLKVVRDDTDDEWESVEKPDEPADNAPAEKQAKDDEEIVNVTKAEAQEAESAASGGGTAHSGPPSHGLMKDW